MPVDLGDGFIHGCECDCVALGCSSDWLWSPSGCGCACVRACVRACVVGGTLVSRHCRAFLAVTCSQSEPTGPPLSTAGGSQRLSCGPAQAQPAAPLGSSSLPSSRVAVGVSPGLRCVGCGACGREAGPLLCHRDCLGSSPGSATSQLCGFRPVPKLSGLSFPICKWG